MATSCDISCPLYLLFLVSSYIFAPSSMKKWQIREWFTYTGCLWSSGPWSISDWRHWHISRDKQLTGPAKVHNGKWSLGLSWYLPQICLRSPEILQMACLHFRRYGPRHGLHHEHRRPDNPFPVWGLDFSSCLRGPIEDHWDSDMRQSLMGYGGRNIFHILGYPFRVALMVDKSGVYAR